MNTYKTSLVLFDCGKWGLVPFKHWEHPLNEPMRGFLNEGYIDAWAKYVEPGMTCIDVGGYIGDTAVIMAVIVGPSGRVTAFEPNPYVFEVLVENSKLHPTITPLPLAVLDVPGFVEFHYTDDGFCNGGFISKVQSGIGTCAQTVPLRVFGVPLQSVVHEADLIKIDTEGYDRFILESIRPLLLECRPRIIVESFKGLNAEEKRLLLAAVPPDYMVQEFYTGEPVDLKYAIEHQHFDFVCLPVE